MGFMIFNMPVTLLDITTAALPRLYFLQSNLEVTFAFDPAHIYTSCYFLIFLLIIVLWGGFMIVIYNSVFRGALTFTTFLSILFRYTVVFFKLASSNHAWNLCRASLGVRVCQCRFLCVPREVKDISTPMQPNFMMHYAGFIRFYIISRQLSSFPQHTIGSEGRQRALFTAGAGLNGGTAGLQVSCRVGGTAYMKTVERKRL